jgi:hypothetical protein
MFGITNRSPAPGPRRKTPEELQQQKMLQVRLIPCHFLLIPIDLAALIIFIFIIYFESNIHGNQRTRAPFSSVDVELTFPLVWLRLDCRITAKLLMYFSDLGRRNGF